jgi:hypothetical protein
MSSVSCPSARLASSIWNGSSGSPMLRGGHSHVSGPEQLKATGAWGGLAPDAVHLLDVDLHVLGRSALHRRLRHRDRTLRAGQRRGGMRYAKVSRRCLASGDSVGARTTMSMTDSLGMLETYLTAALGTSALWKSTPCTECVDCRSSRKTPLPTGRDVCTRPRRVTFLPAHDGSKSAMRLHTYTCHHHHTREARRGEAHGLVGSRALVAHSPCRSWPATARAGRPRTWPQRPHPAAPPWPSSPRPAHHHHALPEPRSGCIAGREASPDRPWPSALACAALWRTPWRQPPPRHPAPCPPASSSSPSPRACYRPSPDPSPPCTGP